MKVVVCLKGGKGSGHHGHSGRPGMVGGSVGGKGASVLKQATQSLSGYATNKHREQLVEAFATEFPQALARFGLEESDVLEMHIVGSFASSKERPGDIDIFLKFSEDLPVKGVDRHGTIVEMAGLMDFSVWSQHDHTAPIAFIKTDKMYNLLLKGFGDSMREKYGMEPVKIYGRD